MYSGWRMGSDTDSTPKGNVLLQKRLQQVAICTLALDKRPLRPREGASSDERAGPDSQRGHALELEGGVGAERAGGILPSASENSVLGSLGLTWGGRQQSIPQRDRWELRSPWQTRRRAKLQRYVGGTEEAPETQSGHQLLPDASFAPPKYTTIRFAVAPSKIALSSPMLCALTRAAIAETTSMPTSQKLFTSVVEKQARIRGLHE
jgi:hypothetical protein